MSDDDQKRQHLHELVEGFETAMLVTRTRDGSLRARPLSLSSERDEERLYFCTSVESGTVWELEADQHVAVTFQDRKRYVSITGTARLSRDPALIERLWTPSWKAWFPKGKEDPALAILAVLPYAGEYWDETGMKGLHHLAEAMKAYAKGGKPGGNGRQNAKVPL